MCLLPAFDEDIGAAAIHLTACCRMCKSPQCLMLASGVRLAHQQAGRRGGATTCVGLLPTGSHLTCRFLEVASVLHRRF